MAVCSTRACCDSSDTPSPECTASLAWSGVSHPNDAVSACYVSTFVHFKSSTAQRARRHTRAVSHKPVATHIHGRLARPSRPTKPYQVYTTSCVLQVRQTGKAACLPAGNRAGAPPDYLVAPQYAFPKRSFLCSRIIKHTASVPLAVTPFPLYSSPSKPLQPTSLTGYEPLVCLKNLCAALPMSSSRHRDRDTAPVYASSCLLPTFVHTPASLAFVFPALPSPPPHPPGRIPPLPRRPLA
eukprot:351703-Chlamydomonas_euryale.AAC.6